MHSVVQVTIGHDDAATVSNGGHYTEHRLGSSDRIELHVHEASLLELPEQVTSRILQLNGLEVFRRPGDVLVIAKPALPVLVDEPSKGWTPMQHFDILAGHEVKLKRLKVAQIACSAAVTERSLVTKAHPLKLPSTTVDRLCDLLRRSVCDQACSSCH